MTSRMAKLAAGRYSARQHLDEALDREAGAEGFKATAMALRIGLLCGLMVGFVLGLIVITGVFIYAGP